MFNTVFNKKDLSDDDQLTRASFFTIQASSALLMKKKKINDRQCYFLINHLLTHSSNESPLDSAFYIIRSMADLNRETTYIDFIRYSGFIKKLEKQYKEFCLENLMILTFLDNNEENLQLNYINYFYTDLEMGGDFGFSWLANRAYKKYKKLQIPKPTEEYSNALDIIRDALYRTTFVPS